MRKLIVLIVGILCAGISATVLKADEDPVSSDVLLKAVNRSLPLLQQAAAGTARNRKCFTCHGQALPVMVMVEARNRGLAIDESILKQQLQHTINHMKRGKSRYESGKGQGGRADMAGYGLWTLEAGGWKADETTAVVVDFVLKYQQDLGHWKHNSYRPPSEASDFTTTYVALRGLTAFGIESQQPAIVERTSQVKRWLLKTEPKDTEDRVFHLRSLKYVDAGGEAIQAAAKQLAAEQRPDGGWAQLPKMKSDAYATGAALAALSEVGGVSTDDPVYQRGLKFLIDTQQDDGSWHVTSRSKPFQTYFESGFPHGKDQFISSSASGWATLALLLAMEADR